MTMRGRTVQVMIDGVPLTGSRAGVALAVIAVPIAVIAALMAWQVTIRRRAAAVCSLALLATGAFIAQRWMRVDAIEELRAPLRAISSTIGARFAPMGSGVGSYVRVFEQEAPARLLMGSYVNHAHNEYVQWWLEAGIPALLAMGLGALLLGVVLRALLRTPAQERITGLVAFVSVLAVLAHSLVDYPLRTPALLAITAALLGIAVGDVLRSGTTSFRSASRRGDNRRSGRARSTAISSS